MTFGPKVRTLCEALMSKTRITSTSDLGVRALPPFLRRRTSLDALKRLIGFLERAVNQASGGF